MRGPPVLILSVQKEAKMEVHALNEAIERIAQIRQPTIIKIEHLEDEISGALYDSTIMNEVNLAFQSTSNFFEYYRSRILNFF
jgi:hypothetical protein